MPREITLLPVSFELDEIIDRAADDMSITNTDYSTLYAMAMEKARSI